MKIAILSLFPEMFESFLNTSIIGRARQEKLIDIKPVDIRPYSLKKHKNTDDYPFGGGAGMVMMAQPIVDCVRDMRSQGYNGRCIYLSPRGKQLNQQKVVELAQEEGLILLAAYATEDLSQTSLQVLSVYGSEDRVMDSEKYTENLANLPSGLTEMVLEGGCHAYFGMYGAQEGDGIPRITNEEQILLTAEAVFEMTDR